MDPETFLFVLIESTYIEIFRFTVHLHSIKFSLIVGIESVKNQLFINYIILHKFDGKLSPNSFEEFLENQIMRRLHHLGQAFF